MTEAPGKLGASQYIQGPKIGGQMTVSATERGGQRLPRKVS